MGDMEGKGRKANTTFTGWFTPSISSTARTRLGYSWELNSGLPMGHKYLNTNTVPYCLPGCTITGSLNQEQSRHQSPGTLILDAGIANGI